MPISIVVGGQFGSEGKGKVALELARRAKEPVTVVRVGGPNSGHTGYDYRGKKWALRQMPASCVDRNVDVVFPAGSYIDVEVFLKEIEVLRYPKERLVISPYARIITEQHKAWEREAGLVGSIGSTGSGVGGAVMASVARGAQNLGMTSPDAAHYEPLAPFVRDASEHLRRKLDVGERVIVEGTQGFGLSLLDGGYWPKATSRATTAAAALAETGLSPLDVDDVTMVIRSYPIRVAGESGPLLGETTWKSIGAEIDDDSDLTEYTTVTNKIRRVGKFDPELVRKALIANSPTNLVLNHLDYVGNQETLTRSDSRLSQFITYVEGNIGRSIDWYGFSPLGIVDASLNEHRNAFL
ncbi:adenylosuccinate synthetase [Mesorhizobium sp. LSJC269B00]|uniref:adenylosuccinate synthetase n=1 Tax=Mesorhizobium sp. LSJC269B00 TaxID=1287326 RepID=UPI000A0798F6|nr:adenylosuccinate synthetase [Mesorhizobium sp. LSJC269B00]